MRKSAKTSSRREKERLQVLTKPGSIGGKGKAEKNDYQERFGEQSSEREEKRRVSPIAKPRRMKQRRASRGARIMKVGTTRGQQGGIFYNKKVAPNTDREKGTTEKRKGTSNSHAHRE